MSEHYYGSEEPRAVEPPSLPPPRMISRTGNGHSYVHRPSYRKSQENVLTDADCVSIARKPVPLPRTKVLQRRIESDSNSVGTMLPSGEPPQKAAPNNISPEFSVSTMITDLDQPEIEPDDDYMPFTAIGTKYLDQIASSPSCCSSPSTSSVLSELIFSHNGHSHLPLDRSVSDSSCLVRNSNLIQWDSVDQLATINSSPRPADCDREDSDDFIFTAPPAYSPPPPPVEDVMPEDEDNSVSFDSPPPLPPRPAFKELATQASDHPPLPLPVGNKNAVVRRENEVRNGIATLCNGFLDVKQGHKDTGKRWCVLKDGKLSIYADRKCLIAKTSILCADMLDITSFEDKKNRLTFGFEICSIKDRNKPWIFLAESSNDMSRWIRTLAKCICDASGMHLALSNAGNEDFEFGGKIFIRHGASGQWTKSWVELSGRTLTVLYEDQIESCDLRKAVALNLVNFDFYESKTAVVCPEAVEENKPFIVNMPGRALHFQADYEKLTMQWMKLMQKRARACGEALEDQPLTSEDVPVLIDKCIQFVSAHGLKTEGIYRHSGVSSRIASVLDAFAKEGHACHLSREVFTEHDVAGALKRFLRNLPEPLIKIELYQPLLCCAEMITSIEPKLEKYKSLLEQLPRIPNYVTLKKLMGHLKVVTESSAVNLMTIPNIAASFGSTLMAGNMKAGDMADTVSENNYDGAAKEISVMVDFLTYYERLFDVKPEELDKERKILTALEIISKQMLSPPRAGDFLMGVHWLDRKGESFNMRISNKLTAGELCRSFLERQHMEPDNSYSLHEMLFDDKLWRPVHFGEEVIPIILRWTAWNESNICQYSSNYLCVRKNTTYDQVIPWIKAPLSVPPQVRFSKDKRFNKVAMTFTKMRITCLKATDSDKELGSWNIEEILWFFGTTRSAPTKCTFTFIEKENFIDRLKEHRAAFGYTVCCEDETDLMKWVASLLQAQHGLCLFPPLPQ